MLGDNILCYSIYYENISYTCKKEDDGLRVNLWVKNQFFAQADQILSFYFDGNQS